MSKGKYYFSKSLEKGLKILALFSQTTSALTQSEIAKKLELNMTSTYRYINTLVELGYLEKDPTTKIIRPAILCLPFCNNLLRATDYMHLIQGVIDRVHSEYNISIDAAFVVEDNLVRIYHRSASETLTYRLPDSSSNCLHNTALGKAYLSSLDPIQLQQKVEKMILEAKTKQTITDTKTLLSELECAKNNGYAVNMEEYLPGLVAIAAPLRDPRTGRGVGAISFDFSLLQNGAVGMEKKFSGLVSEVAKTLSELIPPDRHGSDN